MTAPTKNAPTNPGNQTSEMTETDLAAIMAAVTLAKHLQLRNPQSLRTAMIDNGFTELEAGRAMVFWGDYERAKTAKK